MEWKRTVSIRNSILFIVFLLKIEYFLVHVCLCIYVVKFFIVHSVLVFGFICFQTFV